VHQLADIVSILEAMAMLSGEAHALVLDIHLVPLVVLEVTPVYHPEVEIDV
jgi:hypothetical protein